MSEQEERTLAKHGRFMFIVDNNLRGRLFIWALKRFLNRKTYRVILRGRGARRAIARRQRVYEGEYDQDLTVELSERIAIYIDIKPTWDKPAPKIIDDGKQPAPRAYEL